MQATAGPESAFDALYYQLILRIYAAMNGLGGGAKTEFVPGRGKPQVRPCLHLMPSCNCALLVMVNIHFPNQTHA